MELCPYGGYSNYDNGAQCRKCDGPFVSRPATTVFQKSFWIGPEKAQVIRNKALAYRSFTEVFLFVAGRDGLHGRLARRIILRDCSTSQLKGGHGYG